MEITKKLKRMSASQEYGILEVFEEINDFCLKVNKSLLNIHTYDEMVDELEKMARMKVDYFDGFAIALSQSKNTKIFYCDFTQWEKVKRKAKYIPLLLPINDKTQLVNLAIKQLRLK